jgi:hypothetical protein
MAVLAEMTAKRPERGDSHASADHVVLLDELVGMAVFNKRIDDLTGEHMAVLVATTTRKTARSI